MNGYDAAQQITRRHFFRSAGVSVGAIAFASLIDRDLFGAGVGPGLERVPLKGLHFPAKAKSIIFLCQDGAPSQLDLFDYKPKLQQYHGTPVPEELVKGERFAFLSGRPQLLGPQFKFDRYGQTGTYVSDLLPQIAGIVDETAFVYSLTTDQFNHTPAQLKLFTGHERSGRPSMGSWLT